MNDFKKRLIAVGLSAVTAVTMVSTVFAEDVQNPNTEDTTQLQTASETTTVTVTLIKLSDNTSLGSVEVTVEGEVDMFSVATALNSQNKIPTGYEIGGSGSTGPNVSQNTDGTYTAYLNAVKTVTVNIVKSDDTSNPIVKTISITDGLTESVESSRVLASVRQYIPENYTEGSISKNNDGSYTLLVNKSSSDEDTNTTQYSLYVFKDEKQVSQDESFTVESSKSDEEIQQYIYDNFYSKYASGETVVSNTIEKISDSEYRFNLILNKERTYNLKITKDGVEQETTTFKVTSNYRDDDAINKYLQENYVPKGYSGYINGWTYDDESPTYSFVLTKNKYAGEGKKTYTLKYIDLASDYVWDQWVGMYENALKNAKVEYKTFEFDSSASKYEFVNYIKEHFAPKEYPVYDATTHYGAIEGKYCTVSQVDESTWVMLGPNYQATTSNDSVKYTVKYLDVDTNNFVSVETEGSAPVISYTIVYFKSEKDKLTVSEINSLPTGYVFVGDSFETVSDGNNEHSVTAKVKKAEYKTPVTVDYYVSKNGTLEYLCTKTGVAEDLDTNNTGVVNYFKELTSIVPKGYVVSNLNRFGYFYYDTAKLNALWEAGKTDELSEEFNETGWGATGPSTFQAYSIHVSCYLEPLADLSTNELSDSKATLDDSKALSTLVDSLDTTLKAKYDQAIGEGKEVKFVPTVTTANLDSKSEKAVKAEASKLGYSSVEVFDITLAMNIDGKQAGTITETSSPLTFKVTIPETLKKDGRKFYVLRYHDGEVEKLDVDENGYFTTDKFSVYMLVYEDVKTTPTDNKKEDISKEENSNTSNSDKTGTDTSKTNLISTKDNKKTTADSKKSSGVNTSTRTNSSLFVGFGALALTGAAIVSVLKRKNELD